jgi:hypothetical protein
MRSLSLWTVLFMAALLPAAENAPFRTLPAAEYRAHQKQHEFTVAVKPYHREADMREAFGKVKPFKFGVLPVLVVITNDSDHALGLDGLKIRFVESGRDGLEPVSGEDLAYVNASSKPKERPRYIPRIPGIGSPKVKKGPLAAEIITQREFVAPVVLPHSSASGFFYYLTGSDPDPVPGSTMYITGITNLSTKEELFFFEIPLDRGLR